MNKIKLKFRRFLYLRLQGCLTLTSLFSFFFFYQISDDIIFDVPHTYISMFVIIKAEGSVTNISNSSPVETGFLLSWLFSQNWGQDSN